MLEAVERYYSEKIAIHGRSPQGADWKSAESQAVRFDQLLRLLPSNEPFTINDYGCGYGALVDHLKIRGCNFRYRGFDISNKMIAEARKAHGKDARCEFFQEKSRLSPADYTVASGIFNVKLSAGDAEWWEYILAVLSEFSTLSRKAFAFNALSSYSDPEFMKPHLYYAEPLRLFDHCKTKLSSRVSLLHDYPLYEFTIAVQIPRGAE
jgi:SAM-dependent methyltransferase